MYIFGDRLQLGPLTHHNHVFILELVKTPGWLQFIGDRGSGWNVICNFYDIFSNIFYQPEFKMIDKICSPSAGIIKKSDEGTKFHHLKSFQTKFSGN